MLKSSVYHFLEQLTKQLVTAIGHQLATEEGSLPPFKTGTTIASLHVDGRYPADQIALYKASKVISVLS